MKETAKKLHMWSVEKALKGQCTGRTGAIITEGVQLSVLFF